MKLSIFNIYSNGGSYRFSTSQETHIGFRLFDPTEKVAKLS
jgi:hypothetical protein